MFRKVAIWIGAAIGAAAAAIAAGATWWDLWMRKSWPGATGWLAKAMQAQGDAYYDAMQDEMTIWIFIALMAGMIIIQRTVLNRKRHRS